MYAVVYGKPLTICGCRCKTTLYFYLLYEVGESLDISFSMRLLAPGSRARPIGVACMHVLVCQPRYTLIRL